MVGLIDAGDVRRDVGDSLHARIRADVEVKIRSGTWPPGFRIPFEHELMRRYGCARMTVSKALSGLAADGLIERRRRAGSFVARPQIRSAVLEVHDIRAQIAERGMTYALEILSRRQRSATKADRERLELRAPAGVLAIGCRHLANGRPFVIEDRLINLAVVPEAAAIDFAHEPPGTWLIGHVGWTEAEHRISALAADPNQAARLEIGTGDPCLVIRRRTWRDRLSITAATLVYPASNYEMIARFGRR